MVLSEKRRSFLLFGSVVSVAAGAGLFRFARAQSVEEALSPIFEEQVWRDPAEFGRLERLIWTAFELKYVYRTSFKEITGLELPAPELYSITIRRVIEEGRNATDAGAADSTIGSAAQSFKAALEANSSIFGKWLEGIGILPNGLLAAELVKAQALLALLGLISDGFETLEDRGAAGDDDCAIFYPFCSF